MNNSGEEIAGDSDSGTLVAENVDTNKQNDISMNTLNSGIDVNVSNNSSSNQSVKIRLN